MALERLVVTDLRCIEAAQLEPDRISTLVYGENGSGKTSLLEAIYLLGSGRSFRASDLSQLIRTHAQSFVSVGHLRDELGTSTLGVSVGPGGTQVRLDGMPARTFADLATRFPVQVIEPGIHKLLEEGPARRRRLMDWGVFHVEHTFGDLWRRFQRALKQRAAGLRSGRPESEIRLWDVELITCGQQIAVARERYLLGLSGFFAELTQFLLGDGAEIVHQRGWRAGVDYEQALHEAWARDRVLKTTTVGPHRADLSIRMAGVPAKERVSRGQQKLMVAAFILAQQRHRTSLGATPACLLVDDPAAELDVDNLGKLMHAISETALQLVATGLTKTALGSFPVGRMFHVERGMLNRVL